MTKIPKIGDQLDAFEEFNRQRRDDKLKEMAQEKEAQEVKRRDQIDRLLARSVDDLSPSDFSDFKDELQAYDQRFRLFKKEYDSASNGTAKEEIHKKMVFPQTHDDEAYREIAKLYLKFRKVLQEGRH